MISRHSGQAARGGVAAKSAIGC